MLREYRLTNFKAFGETVTIPIRPLTLIFGANSSGKSSIFQSMLLLKQTLEEAKNPETALLLKGSLVDLGRYRDFVHRHEIGRNFEFGARFDLEKTQYPRLFSKIHKSASAVDIGLAIQFFYDQEKDSATLGRGNVAIGDETYPLISYIPFRRAEKVVTVFRLDSELDFWRNWWENTKKSTEFKKISSDWKHYQFEDILTYIALRAMLFSILTYKNFLPAGRRISISFDKRSDEAYGGYSTDSVDRHLRDILERKGKIPAPYISYIHDALELMAHWKQNPLEEHLDISHGLEIEAKEDNPLNIVPIIGSTCSAFRRLLEDLVYLGPLRSQPERYSTFSGDTTDYVGQSGEYLPSILFKRPKLLEQINGDLKRLNVKYRLKLDKFRSEDASLSNVFSLLLVDTRTEIDASLRDVGFGISQVLPIVVQSRLSEKKTLLIEQPEIHLHPAHQAELGDMFIRSALGEQGNTFLLETHSEHLLLRIMRRIRETTDNDPLPEGIPAIRPEDVAVLYVQPGEGDEGAQVIEIPVTEDGDFARLWPEGFFAERSKELF